MIKLFTHKIPFAPMKFLNAVARWILGVHSSDGTVIVKNTANPGDDGSVDLRVNIEAVCNKVERLVGQRGLSSAQRTAVKEIIRGKIDGKTLIVSGEHVSVSDDYINELINAALQSNNDNNAPFDTIASGYSVGTNIGSRDGTSHMFGSRGLVCFLPFRSIDNGQEGSVFWRECKITPDGRFLYIGGESQANGYWAN